MSFAGTDNEAEMGVQRGRSLPVQALAAFARNILRAWYWAKFAWYKLLVGSNAASYVLYESLRPDIVLRMFGASVGKNVRVNLGLMLHEAGNDFSRLRIGDDVHIGKFVIIDLTGRVTIGNRVGIGMSTRILTHQNLGDSRLSLEYPRVSGDIVIPDDAVISSGSYVLYPTVMEPGTLVSAATVVRGEYPGVKFLVGNPARASIQTPKRT